MLISFLHFSQSKFLFLSFLDIKCILLSKLLCHKLSLLCFLLHSHPIGLLDICVLIGERLGSFLTTALELLFLFLSLILVNVEWGRRSYSSSIKLGNFIMNDLPLHFSFKLHLPLLLLLDLLGLFDSLPDDSLLLLFKVFEILLYHIVPLFVCWV